MTQAPRWLGLVVWFALVACHERSILGDDFRLAHGGRIAGSEETPTDGSPSITRVRVSSGIAIAIDGRQVAEVVREKPALIAYRELAPTIADTAEAQWRLAEWCRERKLVEERAVHLARVIALDPDHGPAHRGLGRSHVGGRWVHRDQRLSERGYQLYRGKWRLPQEIDLLERAAKRELAEKEWRQRVMRLRSSLDKPAGAEALTMISKIREPSAGPALAELLANDRLRAVKLACLEALIAMAKLPQEGADQAVAAIAECALASVDEEVFHAAVDALVSLREPDKPQVSLLFIKALRDDNPRRLNRAAHILGRMGDKRAIGPLIDRLVSIHTTVLPGRRASATKASFGRADSEGGDGGLAGVEPAGAVLETGAGPRLFRQPQSNPQVLEALVRLTGVNLGYDAQTWRAWQSHTDLAADAPVAAEQE